MMLGSADTTFENGGLLKQPDEAGGATRAPSSSRRTWKPTTRAKEKGAMIPIDIELGRHGLPHCRRPPETA
jgi:hypothetical protein